ncbi:MULTISPECIES: ABC transporter ATP-binding protein [Micromonospora]|uniref:Spermidine/putrescine ABC transporter ATP-binding protein n=1 Tax=Micromonospora haikouensis TaxID=686309 RepID=A0A0D0VKN2_9ACTN|nr:ABC transporter ATP-binding protein [Micromonospora haikouensis]KIR61343.1 spermidine/putrescine ABC transporter ATP-binding protein [Micromonospora haikouensis]
MTGEHSAGGALRIRALRRKFGSFAALESLDLDVPAGEFVALLGPSGCGKSTALNLLAGLLEPTTGAISLDGRRIDRLPPEKRGIGMVFQNYALFPHLTVADNIAFGLRMRGCPKPERVERVRRALDLVRLRAQADRYPRQLSGGQQQRVAIARAVVVEPRLVLMDEPLSNLDASLRLDLRTEIRSLHQQLGLTTIYVTHDQVEALSLADRLVVLRDGAVQQVGTPAEVYERPANAFVAAFVGYRNSVPGKLTAGVVDAGPVALRIDDPGSGLPEQGSVVAMIRPEDLLITRESGGGTGNELSIDVRVCEYQGRTFAVEGTGPGGHLLHGRSDQPFRPGERAVAVVAPDRIRTFPAPAEAAPAIDRALLVGQEPS